MRAMLDTIHEISVALASAAWGVAGPQARKRKKHAQKMPSKEKPRSHAPTGANISPRETDKKQKAQTLRVVGERWPVGVPSLRHTREKSRDFQCVSRGRVVIYTRYRRRETRETSPQRRPGITLVQTRKNECKT